MFNLRLIGLAVLLEIAGLSPAYSACKVALLGAAKGSTSLSIQMHQTRLLEVPLLDLFPEIPEDKIIKYPLLRVSPEHEIYIEETGNPKGKPILFLHGGPGVGVKPGQNRFFDPKKWRIINFAQRGSPPSKTSNLMKGNTTSEIIEDMEKIRELLGISKWTLFGGSWGSTLGMAYAIEHPQKVEA